MDQDRTESPSGADPAPQAEWELWYRDTFDRECPPSVDCRGRGLAGGLTELWARHLFETVRPGGGTGFSRFHLRWEQTYARIEGDRSAQVRLREWVFGTQDRTRRGYVQAGDADLLARIALAHAHLLVDGRSCAPILSAVAAAADRRDFVARLLDVTRS